MIPPSQASGATPSLPLKDLYLPDAISWWPLAPGWWILLALVVIAIFVVIYAARKYWINNKTKRQTRELLHAAFKQWQSDQNDDLYFQQINTVLKRYCRHEFPHAVSLSGQHWIDFLNDTSKGNRSDQKIFHGQAAQAIGEYIYRPATNDFRCDQQALLDSCIQWLKQVKNQPLQEQK